MFHVSGVTLSCGLFVRRLFRLRYGGGVGCSTDGALGLVAFEFGNLLVPVSTVEQLESPAVSMYQSSYQSGGLSVALG